MSDEMTAIDRAVAKARQMLKTYRHDPGVSNESQHLLIADVLADVQHYCAKHDIDFEAVLDQSRSYVVSDREEGAEAGEDAPGEEKAATADATD